MKYQKSWTEALLEVQDITEDAKMGKQSDDQLKKLYKTASEKDQSSPANKSFTQRVAKEMKKRGISEQEGVRKVDFVDGISPELQEAKPEFEVKYATSKKGPIKVTKFMSLDKAKEFLDQVKKHGSNGIISKGGKPIKEAHTECPKCKGEGCEHCDGKGYHEEKVDENPVIAGIAAKAAQEKLKKKKKKPELKNEETLEEHCGECEESIEEKMDGRKKNSGKQAKKDNEDRRAAQRKKLGILGPNEETINEADYELYHKDFSSAMQHAYAHAKKKGFIVDPQEIDDKVATGPKKPSKGKTNRYILGTDKKKKVHIQVANLDNKKYELNMYIEETEKENMDINETIKQVMEGKKKWQKTGLKNAKKDPVASKGDNWQNTGLKNEDSDKSEPGTQGDDKEYQKKRDAILKKYGVKSCAMCKTDAEKKACFNELDKAHVGDHEEQIQKEADDEQKGDYGVKKKAKEPQDENTLLDKVKNLMKEKKSKKY